MTSGSATAAAIAQSRPARPGCRERSTAWVSGRATPTCRGRARARGAVRDPDPTRPDAGEGAVAARREKAGTPLPPWKAVTGERALHARVGAVAAQFHEPPAIEPYASELVGAERGIVLGKKSGIDSIRIALASSGSTSQLTATAELLASVKRSGRRSSGLVTDDELAARLGVAATDDHRAAGVLRGDASFPPASPIVTTLDEDDLPRGLTTTAGLQRLEPTRRRLVCVDLASRTPPRSEPRQRSSCNFMGEGRSELGCFRLEGGGQSSRTSRGARYRVRPAASRRRHALAGSTARRPEQLEVGDHVAFVAEVEDGVVRPELEPPLLYDRRRGACGPRSPSADEPTPSRSRRSR